MIKLFLQVLFINSLFMPVYAIQPKVSAGRYGTLIIRPNGTLWVWGTNVDGQLGLGASGDRISPTQVGVLNWSDVSYKYYHSIAIKNDGTLWACGPNFHGQLGLGDTLNKPTLVQVGVSTWSLISAGGNHSLAIKHDHTLWAWGDNSYGPLGLGDTTDRITPVQIGVSTWATVSAGVNHTAAIKNDGTLWTWGYNASSQLGLGDSTNRATPAQVGVSTWATVSSGGQHTIAIKSDGTLWAWGANSYGQLGLGDTTSRDTPTQIGVSSWSAVSINYFNTLAIKSDGTLWAWGQNTYGQLGLGDTTNRTVPTQVGVSSWSAVTLSQYHTIAIKSDGTYWAWGNNNDGEIGLEGSSNRLIPTFIGPTLSWTGDPDYTTGGMIPNTGDRSTNFVYRVKYNNPWGNVASGYPKVHIKKGNAEITGSPFTTGLISGTPVEGAIYSYTKNLVPGTDYTYYFDAQDSDNTVAIGVPTTPISGPTVYNNSPTQLPALAWTDEANYSASGVYPFKGTQTDNYIFRVKYSDTDGNAPAVGYPKVSIKQGGTHISGSPFTMSFVSGTNNVGAIYTFSKTLGAAAYNYSFEAQNIDNFQAIGSPLTEQSGPVVIGAELPPAQEVKVYHGVFKPGLNEKTNISFNTAAPVSITVTVYNNVGRKVKELYHGASSTGLNLIQWDGRDEGGTKVSSGVYTIKIEGGGINQSKRVVVVR